uniref:Uncharacterized protein n=1 Tax=Globodera rostochiensis TaxID=31243 RepID=A0A914H0U2_GLORO
MPKKASSDSRRAWLLTENVEQKIVTATYILRHTPLNAFQTQKLMQEFLESNSAVSANYYLLGLLKGGPGKKHCAIVRREELTSAKRRLTKLYICSIFSVQTARFDSLESVLRADWMDQTAPVLFKGFLRDSEAENAYRIWTKGRLQSDLCSLSPISQPKGKKDGEEVNEEAGDEEEMEESLELKKSKRKPFRRPILFTPMTKEEEKQQIVVESRPSREKNSGSGDLPSAHPPAKRPMAQPIKRETKQPKTNSAPKSGGSKQTTIFIITKNLSAPNRAAPNRAAPNRARRIAGYRLEWTRVVCYCLIMSNRQRQLTIASAETSLHAKGIRLRTHQREGITKLLQWHDEGHGGILADEMGLGKTCQAILTAAILADRFGKEMRMLVICPLSVIDHWEKEVSRFGCGRLTVSRYYGDDRMFSKTGKWNVLLTTYEVFLNDRRKLNIKKWCIVVFDEAQRVKNKNSLAHKALSRFNIDWLLLMTGTPIQNDMFELYALLMLVAPDEFTPDKEDSFVRRFAKLGKNDNVSQRFRELFNAFCLRRNKKILDDVPVCSEVILYHGLSKLQYDMYRALLMDNRDFFAKNMHTEKQARQSLMSPMMQLLKCCDHPYLFRGIEKEPFEEGEHLVNDSGKALILDRLLAYLHKKEHRVLIFTQMQRFLDIVYDIVQLRGYTCVQLDGTVKASERQEAIEEFQQADSDIFAFLLTTKAGGLGLNLTGADTAAARCHRIGQDKPVKIIRLVAKHTIEELIKYRAGKKLKLSELVLGTDENDGQSSKVDLSKLLFEGLSNLEEAQKRNIQLHELTDKQLEEKLGRTKRGGRWEIRDDNKEDIDDDQQQLLSDGDSTDETEERTLYMFEGQDYRQKRAAVKKADDGLGNNTANSRADDNDKKQQRQQ